MCSGVDGLERSPPDFAKQAACEKAALACHSAGLVRFEGVALEACCDVRAHALDTLWARGQCDVVCVCADDHPLDLVAGCWWLPLAGLHVVAQGPVEVLEGAKTRVCLV